MCTKIVRLVDWKCLGLTILFVLIPLFRGEAQEEYREMLSLAWKPDSSQFATGYGSGEVGIWDAATSQQVLVFPFAPDEPWSGFEGTPFQVRGLAWSPDGSRLAAGASAGLNAGLYRIFDPTTGELLASFDADNSSTAVAWSPDGTQLAASVIQGSGPAAQNWIEVRDVATGQLAARVDTTLYNSQLTALAWSPDGTRFVSVSFDQRAILWDTATWSPLRTMEDPELLYTVAWSADGGKFATGDWDGSIRIWNAVTGHLLMTLPSGYEDPVYQISWQSDGVLLASAAGHALQIWSTDSGILSATVASSGQYSDYTLVAWSPDGTQLLYYDGSLQEPVVIPVSTMDFPSLPDVRPEISSLAWKPDSSQFASGCINGQVGIWDAATSQQILEFPFAPDEPWFDETPFQVSAVAWSPDGTKLAASASAAGFAGLYRVFDAGTGEILATFQAADGSSAVAWSPDGTQLAASVIQGNGTSAQTWIEVRDVVSGQLVARTDAAYPGSLLPALAWSPDGTKLASTFGGQRSIIWDTTTWKPLFVLRQRADVQTVAWSPDGSRLATGDWDGFIQIWDTLTGQSRMELSTIEHRAVNQISWRPGGLLLASASSQALQIWNTDYAVLSDTVVSPARLPYYTLVAWSPDGSQLLYYDRSLREPEIVLVSSIRSLPLRLF
jgi:WD40 repeat protein